MNAINEEVVLPNEKELRDIREFFVSDEWFKLKTIIEREMEDLKDFILDDSDVGTEINVSQNSMFLKCNRMVETYIPMFGLTHIENVLRRFVIDDNNRKRLYLLGGEICKYSQRDVERNKCKILRYFLSFEEVYKEKSGQAEETDDNTDNVGLDSQPLWEGIGISR